MHYEISATAKEGASGKTLLIDLTVKTVIKVGHNVDILLSDEQGTRLRLKGIITE